MIEIFRGISGDQIPSASDVAAEDIDYYLDPDIKGVPELKANMWLKKETSGLEAMISGDDERERAMAQAELATHLALRDTTRAKQLATEALECGERMEDSRVIATAHRSLGRAMNFSGEIRQSAAHSLEAEYLFNDLGNRIREADAMVTRMHGAWASGSVSTAVELEEPIVELLRTAGDECDEYVRLSALSQVYSNLAGITGQTTKDMELVRRYLVLAVAFARAAPEPLVVGEVHKLVGFLLSLANEHAAARPHYARYQLIARKNGAVSEEIYALSLLARTYTAERDFAAAQDTIDEADELIAKTASVTHHHRMMVDGSRIGQLIAHEAWDDAELLLAKIEPDIERSPRRNTAVHLKMLIEVYRAKGTLHEHIDVFDRLIEELERAADEYGAMQLGVVETHRETRRRKDEKRAEKLLHRLLPGGVYAELVESGDSEPRYYPEAVLFFSDFVGFTKIAAALTPRQVIEELSDLFANFDSIMAKHGCERIETIGDAYVAVAGLDVQPSSETPDETPDETKASHSIQMARAAVSIQEYLSERNKKASQIGGSQFVARIGMHCGPIIGGIVGRERVRYGIFGDAVNTTQRLEEACEPGEICVSQELREALEASDSAEFSLIPHGTVEAKGKGLLKVWYVGRCDAI